MIKLLKRVGVILGFSIFLFMLLWAKYKWCENFVGASNMYMCMMK